MDNSMHPAIYDLDYVISRATPEVAELLVKWRENHIDRLYVETRRDRVHERLYGDDLRYIAHQTKQAAQQLGEELIKNCEVKQYELLNADSISTRYSILVIK